MHPEEAQFLKGLFGGIVLQPLTPESFKTLSLFNLQSCQKCGTQAASRTSVKAMALGPGVQALVSLRNSE